MNIFKQNFKEQYSEHSYSQHLTSAVVNMSPYFPIQISLKMDRFKWIFLFAEPYENKLQASWNF